MFEKAEERVKALRARVPMWYIEECYVKTNGFTIIGVNW